MCLKKIFYKILGKKEIAESSPTTTKDVASTISDSSETLSGLTSAEYFVPTPAQVPGTAKRCFVHDGCNFFIRNAYYKDRDLWVLFEKDGSVTEEPYDDFRQECDKFKMIHHCQFFKWYNTKLH